MESGDESIKVVELELLSRMRSIDSIPFDPFPWPQHCCTLYRNAIGLAGVVRLCGSLWWMALRGSVVPLMMRWLLRGRKTGVASNNGSNRGRRRRQGGADDDNDEQQPVAVPAGYCKTAITTALRKKRKQSDKMFVPPPPPRLYLFDNNTRQAE